MIQAASHVLECVFPLSKDDFSTKAYKTFALAVSAIGTIYGTRLTRVPASFAQGIGFVIGSLLAVAVSATKAYRDYGNATSQEPQHLGPQLGFTPVLEKLTANALQNLTVLQFNVPDFGKLLGKLPQLNFQQCSPLVKSIVEPELKHLFSNIGLDSIEFYNSGELLDQPEFSQVQINTSWKLKLRNGSCYSIECITKIDDKDNGLFSLDFKSEDVQKREPSSIIVLPPLGSDNQNNGSSVSTNTSYKAPSIPEDVQKFIEALRNYSEILEIPNSGAIWEDRFSSAIAPQGLSAKFSFFDSSYTNTMGVWYEDSCVAALHYEKVLSTDSCVSYKVTGDAPVV